MLHDHTHEALAPGNSIYFTHKSGFIDGWLIPVGLGWASMQLRSEQLIQPAGRGQLGAAPRDPHLPPWSGHGHCLLVAMSGAWESKQKNVSPSQASAQNQGTITFTSFWQKQVMWPSPESGGRASPDSTLLFHSSHPQSGRALRSYMAEDVAVRMKN